LVPLNKGQLEVVLASDNPQSEFSNPKSSRPFPTPSFSTLSGSTQTSLLQSAIRNPKSAIRNSGLLPATVLYSFFSSLKTSSGNPIRCSTFGHNSMAALIVSLESVIR
jgi:hypothetical protein